MDTMQPDTELLFPNQHPPQLQFELQDHQHPPKDGTIMTLTADKGLLVGPTTTLVTCPYCRSNIKTSVSYTSTTRTHMTAVLCHFICCCCCIPYCTNSARNADHYCPNCQHYLGTYER